MVPAIRKVALLAFSCLGLLMMPQRGAASIAVSQSIDRGEMAFEDTARFQISVTWDGPAHAYRFDKPFRVSVDRMKVARFSSTVRSTGTGPDEKTTKFFVYELSPNLSGMATIEALNIEYVTWPDSLTGILVTDAVSISIRQPRPRDSSDEGGLDSGWWAVIVVCLMGLAFGLYSMFKRKAPTEKIQTVREKFLDELEEAKRESGGDLKKFQTGLCRALISYISGKYRVNTENQTVESVVSELNRIEPDQSVSRTISQWLIRAEKEKYAPIVTAPGEVTRLASEVKQYFDKL
jgi:chaperonin cofactor prefoldin